MKCYIPEISWHNRDPVLSIDFQLCSAGTIRRIATAGTDSHVVIWLVTLDENQHTNLEVAADLNRHTKTVNIVRFSPNGEILASGDDEAAIILWKQQEKDNANDLFVDDACENREQWTPLKILRNHIDDVCDICWAPDSSMLISGSVDNTAILWDVQKGKNMGILSEHKGFVQGVAWDPQGQYVATLASDRILRIFNIHNKKIVHRIQKAPLPNSSRQEPNAKAGKLFYDDTLKSFCRRLRFSPDGEFLVVPSGIQEIKEGEFNNGVYIFSRHSLNKPSVWLPTGSKYTIAVSFCPVIYELRPIKNTSENEIADDQKENKSPWEKYATLFCLPYRTVFAIATQDSILIYDTQQPVPIAYVSNIHYTRLSDITWSSDGRILMASSTDGYCSLVTFEEGELGIPYTHPKSNDEHSPCSDISTETTNKENDTNEGTSAQNNQMSMTGSMRGADAMEKSACPEKLANDKPTIEDNVEQNMECKNLVCDEAHDSTKEESNPVKGLNVSEENLIYRESSTKDICLMELDVNDEEAREHYKIDQSTTDQQKTIKKAKEIAMDVDESNMQELSAKVQTDKKSSLCENSIIINSKPLVEEISVHNLVSNDPCKTNKHISELPNNSLENDNASTIKSILGMEETKNNADVNDNSNTKNQGNHDPMEVSKGIRNVSLDDCEMKDNDEKSDLHTLLISNLPESVDTKTDENWKLQLEHSCELPPIISEGSTAVEYTVNSDKLPMSLPNTSATKEKPPRRVQLITLSGPKSKP